MTPVEKVSAALEARGHPVRNGATRCPAHDDHSPSLTLATGEDGHALVKCHAGCAPEAIVGALGLGIGDLFATSTGRHMSAAYPYVDEAGEVLFEVVRFEPKDFRQRQLEEPAQD